MGPDIRRLYVCLALPVAGFFTVVEELLPAAVHNTNRYENNRVECDHG